MSKIAVFFATGFEEIEALTVVDICRRGGIEVDMVAVEKGGAVTGSHGIEVAMDTQIDGLDFDSYDMLVLPGGMPGTTNLEKCESLMEAIDEFYAAGKYIAAICAAPSIFGHRGMLRGRNACCYPAFESHLEGATVFHNSVEVSEHVITSRGMGTAIEFGLTILGLFCGKEAADNMAKGIIYK